MTMREEHKVFKSIKYLDLRRMKYEGKLAHYVMNFFACIGHIVLSEN